MALVPLFGHTALKSRLAKAAAEARLPGSLLLHGPRGVGKQRLALWLGQLLLCAESNDDPCGRCQHCRYVLQLGHPDLHWYFPRPRLRDGEPSPDEIRADNAEGIQERLKADGLYAAPSGSEAIFLATVKTIVGSASISPAMASRKVYVIGDAERMVAQEGADQAANAFLKLLEEPATDTTIVLTSSEPGALLPTIRSRAIDIRVPPLPARDVAAFIASPIVSTRLKAELGAMGADEMIRLAAGAPGRLLAYKAWNTAVDAARRLIEAAESNDPARRARAALAQGIVGARGGFSDTLDALTSLLRDRAANAAVSRDDAAALGAARGIELVERAKEMTSGNVNPQLITADLLLQLTPLLR